MTEDVAGATTPVADRIEVVDTLRGIALFGVIVMNVTSMVMIFKAQEVMGRAGPVDMAVGLADLLLLAGKARSAFAFLFGLGFGILMERAERRGTAFAPFYLRRAGLLLAIGIVNLVFLFWGDILIVYALLGMVLVLFRGLGQRALLATGLALIVVPPVLAGLVELAIGGALPNFAGLAPEQIGAAYQLNGMAYLKGGYVEAMMANLTYYRLHHLADSTYVTTYNVGVLGLFMLGLWAAREGIFSDIERHRPLLRRIAWWGLPFGLVLSALNAARMMEAPGNGLIGALMTASYVGLPVMAFGYLAMLTLWISRGGAWMGRLFAPVGRMALTAYLASNLIGAFLWYGWGLGLIENPVAADMGTMNAIGVAIFVALSVFAAIWLKAFRFGPVEWVWRSLTYGRLQPLRRRPTAETPAA